MFCILPRFCHLAPLARLIKSSSIFVIVMYGIIKFLITFLFKCEHNKMFKQRNIYKTDYCIFF